MSRRESRPQWVLFAVIAGSTVLALVGCGSNDGATTDGQAGTGAGTELPDACRLVDVAFLRSEMGGRKASPRTERNEKADSRACWWMAPSPEHPEASFGIIVSGEARRGTAGAKQRIARARQLYERETLEGHGGCEPFQGINYRACRFLDDRTLNVTVLKENQDLFIRILATSRTKQGMDRNEQLAYARRLADHVSARL